MTFLTAQKLWNVSEPLAPLYLQRLSLLDYGVPPPPPPPAPSNHGHGMRRLLFFFLLFFYHAVPFSPPGVPPPPPRPPPTHSTQEHELSRILFLLLLLLECFKNVQLDLCSATVGAAPMVLTTTDRTAQPFWYRRILH